MLYNENYSEGKFLITYLERIFSFFYPCIANFEICKILLISQKIRKYSEFISLLCLMILLSAISFAAVIKIKMVNSIILEKILKTFLGFY